ncbi:MAG: hypothetical protein AAGI52_17320 [Bacteroidota bacterium]
MKTKSEEKIKANKEARQRLAKRRDDAQAAVAEARATRGALVDQKLEDEGLAPWDHEVLSLLRESGELPAAAPRDGETLTGKETERLVQATLSISRSSYYERIRPLLRAHHLSESHWCRFTDGSYGRARPQGIKRWRRDEVEAMLRFLQTGSVRISDAPDRDAA